MQVTGVMDKKFDNPQSANLAKVIKDCQTLRLLLKYMGKPVKEANQEKEQTQEEGESSLEKETDIDKVSLYQRC